jgi:hypothetical protein
MLTITGVKDHQERVRGEIILGDLEREVGLHESLARKPIAPILDSMGPGFSIVKF